MSDFLFIEYKENGEVACEKLLSWMELQALISEKSKRRLIARNPHNLDIQAKYLALAFHPTVGFFIFARHAISKNTFIAHYGGAPISKDRADEKLGDDEYILNEEGKGEGLYLEAREFGDFGSLLAHLPNALTVIMFGLQSNACCMENCFKRIEGNDVGFYALRDIPAGEVIGFDYGMSYWCNLLSSPQYFKLNTPKPELAVALLMNSHTYLSCLDYATGYYCRDMTGSFTLHVFSYTLITEQFGKIIENEMLRRAEQRHGNEKYESPNTLMPIENKKSRLKLSVNLRDVMDLEDRHQKKQLQSITFFKVHTQYKGCTPPENTQFKNGMTVIV